MGILLFYTSTTLSDPSISGFIIAIVIFGVYFFFWNRNIFYLYLLLLLCAFVYLLGFKDSLTSFLSFNGRLQVWEYYWKIYTKSNIHITGAGLGKVNQIFLKTPFPTANKIHLEYFQILLETGLIGLILVVNLMRAFFLRRVKDRLDLVLYLMVLGFCLSCLFNFPAHLWLPSTWAMFAYACSMKGEKC